MTLRGYDVAREFAAAVEGQWAWVPEYRSWLRYDARTSLWRPDDLGIVPVADAWLSEKSALLRPPPEEAKELLDDSAPRRTMPHVFVDKMRTRRGIADMLDLARSLAHRSATSFDPDPRLLMMSDGRALLVSAGQVRRGHASDLATKASRVTLPLGAEGMGEADILARMPVTDAWLTAAFGAQRGDLLRLLAYCLTGQVSERVLPLLIGGTASGKSTLMRVMGMVLGDYATQVPAEVYYRAGRLKPGNYFAAMEGCRLVSMSEASGHKEFDEELLKRSTGGAGDSVTVERKYQQPYASRRTWKLMIACNESARLSPLDDALWERIKVFCVAGRITPEDHDSIVAEAPWLLALLLRCVPRGPMGMWSEATLRATAEARGVSWSGYVEIDR